MIFQTLRRVLAGAALVAALSWLLYGPLRPFFIEPLLQAFEVVRRVSLAVPPAILWLVFVLAVYLIAATGWVRLGGDWLMARRMRRSALAASGSPEGRVAVLARWVKRQPRGPFSRQYLKNIVSEIAVESLAQAHRVSPAQIKAALKAGALELPPGIAVYLQAGLSPWPLEPVSSLRVWLSRKPPAASADVELEGVLQFLEEMQSGR